MTSHTVASKNSSVFTATCQICEKKLMKMLDDSLQRQLPILQLMYFTYYHTTTTEQTWHQQYSVHCYLY